MNLFHFDLLSMTGRYAFIGMASFYMPRHVFAKQLLGVHPGTRKPIARYKLCQAGRKARQFFALKYAGKER